MKGKNAGEEVTAAPAGSRSSKEELLRAFIKSVGGADIAKQQQQAEAEKSGPAEGAD
mgnify:CR=1 FL=1